MHTLHTRTAQIFKWWAEEHGDDTTVYSLWPKGWCPLLQGIARLCCDSRKQVSSILFEVELNLTNFELFFFTDSYECYNIFTKGFIDARFTKFEWS